ncbi:DUF2934 domain-containing protein [Rhizobium sp. 2TAF27]|uniref:DUF2934 domain-containing protein n=1 Tax=Rhizobium sp. 2TAF27 TaxID=3233013 RepID=UPI003F9C5BF3
MYPYQGDGYENPSATQDKRKGVNDARPKDSSAVEAAKQKSTLRAAVGNGRSPASIREEEIRKRAYFLWEKEGRPQGRHGHHWKLAEHELESEASNPPNLEALREASRQFADAFLVKTDMEDADQRGASPGTREQD